MFLRPFAHVHARLRFPDVSLLAIGLLALPACLFPLDQVINALTTSIVLIQAIAQIAALFVMRRRGVVAPYRMWLYPLPALVALVGWAYIFYAAGASAIAYGLVSLAAGAAVFLVRCGAAAGSGLFALGIDHTRPATRRHGRAQATASANARVGRALEAPLDAPLERRSKSCASRCQSSPHRRSSTPTPPHPCHTHPHSSTSATRTRTLST